MQMFVIQCYIELYPQGDSPHDAHHISLCVSLQLCESKPVITDDMFNDMIAKAKEDLKERQRQLAIQEEEKQKRMVCIFCERLIW